MREEVKMKRRFKKQQGKNRRGSSISSAETENSDSGKDSPVKKKRFFQPILKETLQHVVSRKFQSTGNDSGIGGSQEDSSQIERDEVLMEPVRRRISVSPCDTSTSDFALSETSGSGLETGSSEETSVNPEEAERIYGQCSTLYKAHKINPNNAFKLKLVECLREILKLDQLVGNLLLAAHVLEIGGKIYVCRVDHTYGNTCRLVELVSTMLQDAVEDDCAAADREEYSEDAQPRVTSRKKGCSKGSGRFVVDDDSKLNMQFENRSTDAALRGSSLRIKFSRFVDEDVDFNYLSYFKSMDQAHGANQRRDLESDIPPLPTYSADEPISIPWLPFNHVTHFKPEILNIWGQPLDSENASSLLSVLQMLPSDCDAVTEFTHEPERNQAQGDSTGDDGHGVTSRGRVSERYDSKVEWINEGVADLTMLADSIRSLDDLRRIFESLKPADLVIHAKYGWEGPKSYKWRSTDHDHAKVRKRKKSKHELGYESVDLSAEDMGYKIAKDPTCLLLPDKTIRKWRKEADTLLIPETWERCGFEAESEDIDLPFAALNIDDYKRKFTTFFNDPDRNIPLIVDRSAAKNSSSASEYSHFSQCGDNQSHLDDDLEFEFARVDRTEIWSEGGYDGDPLSSPFEGLQNTDSLLRLFPEGVLQRIDFVVAEEPLEPDEFGQITTYIKHPKPVDMNCLKEVIRQILKSELSLDDNCQPTLDTQSSLGFVRLVVLVERRAGERLRNVTIPLIVIGLLHVVAEAKLFFDPSVGPASFFNPMIVCRGRKWSHRDNIPGDFEI